MDINAIDIQGDMHHRALLSIARPYFAHSPPHARSRAYLDLCVARYLHDHRLLEDGKTVRLVRLDATLRHALMLSPTVSHRCTMPLDDMRALLWRITGPTFSFGESGWQ